MPARRTRMQAIGFSLFLFVIAFGPMFWHDRISRVRTVDVLQLMGAGAVLGVLIANVVALVRSPREG